MPQSNIKLFRELMAYLYDLICACLAHSGGRRVSGERGTIKFIPLEVPVWLCN